MMDYARIGRSGLQVTQITFGSALTIGTEHCDQMFAQDMIDSAWTLGIRSFDLSNNYGMGQAESLVGNALVKYPREAMVVATKGSWPVGESPYHQGLSRKHILWACEESLKRLGMDFVDIYYAHRYDPNTPMEEIVRTFNFLINSGKIRYWATSEWPVDALKECIAVCSKLGLERPVLEQSLYSFAVRKVETNGVKQFCVDQGIGMLGFSPLCQGFLTGKYRNGIPDESRIAKSDRIGYNKTINFYNQYKSRIDQFLDICERYDLPSGRVAILWCIRNGIYPVVGASSPRQLADNVAALQLKVADEVWASLDEVGVI